MRIKEVLRYNGKIYGYTVIENDEENQYTRDEIIEFIKGGKVDNAIIHPKKGNRLLINDTNIRDINRKPLGMFKETYDRYLEYQKMLKMKVEMDNKLRV